MSGGYPRTIIYLTRPIIRKEHNFFVCLLFVVCSRDFGIRSVHPRHIFTNPAATTTCITSLPSSITRFSLTAATTGLNISNWPNCTEAFDTEFERLWAQF
ncbi:hypothetical protein BC937DRAFT_87550 [Endogone sp. FLAS-F59071]|nr:hypothetical protein BC937DRAFT_87550 [Endogone sp. FLAS-F59071]|eukprot:RUS19404.1 hypothetical protein BC937DRAFT_87550 [Endogone sp. FLAS-F59071]